MPIEILDFPEPLTPSALESFAEPVLIKSKAYNQVLHELRRYCNGQSSGRSFLIAGHRGSGKTTLVLSAFEKILRESKDDKVGLRPLRIQLLGPSLLPDLNEKDLAEPGKGAASGRKKLTEFENVLVQITLALYRAVAREFTEAYEKRMTSWAERSADVHQMSSVFEAPGQLVLELDEYPGKARLREFWRRAGALPFGLLPLGSGPGSENQPSNRGVRELVALCSVSEAYRRISGTIQAKSEDKAGDEASTTRSSEIDLKGKDLFGPLITVLAGGAVATGVAALNPDRLGIAALAGVLTALAAAVSGKRSATRTRKRSAAREDLFLPDLSVATLDRVLPVLLDRVRAAGLAPVFVIDELDKVADLSARIPQMVKRLKKLVAESAFFCFLTDRHYFEEMRARNVVTPYSVEYTYFTNYVFVAFAHTDMHAYLAQVLKKPEAPASGPGGMSVEALKLSSELNEEIADHAVLPYVLLHGAQMHPIDLRRQLGEVRGGDGSVALAIGSVRSLRSRRLELLIQVSIELLLEDEPMVWELASDPAFRRLAHDALYFISRQWETVTELRFDDVGKKRFYTYLVDRMKTEGSDAGAATPADIAPIEPEAASGRAARDAEAPDETEESDPDEPTTEDARSKPRAAKAAGKESNSVPPPGPVPPPPQLQPSFTKDQTDFLLEYVHELALLLEDPVKVRSLALTKTGRFAAQVLDTLKLDDIGPLLKRKPKEPNTFRWRYNRAGRPTSIWTPTVARVRAKPAAEEEGAKPAVAGEVPPPDEYDDIELIEKFNAKISEITHSTITCGTLGTGFGVISTSPAWPSVLEAVQRLKTVSGEYAQRGDDLVIVRQFSELLRRSAPVIGMALFSGWVFGKWRPDAPGEERVFAGLQIVSEVLSLKTLPEEKVIERIKDFAEQIYHRLDIPSPDWPPMSDAGSVREWDVCLKDLETVAIPPLQTLKVDTIPERRSMWEFWRGYVQGAQASPDFETVILAAQNRGPSRFLRLPLPEMTAREWSVAFYAALTGNSRMYFPESANSEVPLWLAFVALERLGFGSRFDVALTAPPSLWAGVNNALIQEALRFNVSANPRETHQAIAIVSKEGAESERWKPGKECAGLILRARELMELPNHREQVQDILFRWLGVQELVFDWSGTREPPINIEREIENARPLTGFSTKAVPVILPPSSGSMATLPTPWRRIPIPPSLDELALMIRSTAA